MARKLYNFPFLEVLFWSWSVELQFCKAEGSKCQSFVLNPQPLTFFITQMLRVVITFDNIYWKFYQGDCKQF